MSTPPPQLRTAFHTRLAIFSTLVILAGVACASDRPPFLAGEPSLRTDSTSCPFGDRGARVAVDDAPDGVDVTITTIRDVDELRQRARDSAAMYGPLAHRGLGHNGKHGNGEHHGLGLAELRPEVKSEVTDVPSGAKIHVTPVDPSSVADVRREVRARAERTRWGACP